MKASTLAHITQTDRRLYTILSARLDVQLTSGEAQTYFTPMTIDESSDDENLHAWAIARVRRGSRMGLLYDAEIDPQFGLALAGLISAHARLPASGGGEIICVADDAIPESFEDVESKRLSADQSNTTLQLGEHAIIKIYRRLWPDGNPELEMARYLRAAEFDGTSALLGSIVHRSVDGVITPLAIMQRYVRNQGDAWTRSVDLFRRAFEEMLTAPEDRDIGDALGGFLPLMEALGRRTAQMHAALAKPGDNALFAQAFAPEPLGVDDLGQFLQDAEEEANAAWSALSHAKIDTDLVRASVTAVLTRRDDVSAALNALTARPLEGLKMRVHGDFHLGQILITQQDVAIVDFEGEPAHGAQARRAKDTPMRDVAGMLRSISYAAGAAIQAIEQRLLTDPLRAESMSSSAAQFVSMAFLDAYDSQIAGSRAEIIDPDAKRRLLGLKLLQKALYEIRYEAEFRPTWINLPICGVLNILDQTGQQQ